MPLKTRIDQDIKEAMKAKDQAALLALRAIKSAILLEETAEGRSGDLTEADEMRILSKQVKQRRDAAEQFRKGGRAELAEKEDAEANVIERYLPKGLSPEELEAEVKALIAESGASSIKEMGKVMGLASQRLAGRADNKAISELVRKLLS
ncbi:MAG: GatB/YqeY domain-containing protein [Bacteroidia bacterium]|nr:GatB/YqeY domain-containing protein [Bacteroidia bacterium]